MEVTVHQFPCHLGKKLDTHVMRERNKYHLVFLIARQTGKNMCMFQNVDLFFELGKK